MRFSMPLLVLVGLSLGGSTALGQKATNCIPTETQLVLRQRVAAMKSADQLPSPEKLRADLQRLHQQGKITDEQMQAFEQNVETSYAPYGYVADPAKQAKASQALEVEMAQLRPSEEPTPEVGVTEDQEKAQKILDEKMEELRRAEPAQPAPPPAEDAEKKAKAQEALRQKMTEMQTQPTAQPTAAAAAAPVMSNQDRTLAQQALDAKMAELEANAAPPPPAPSERTPEVIVVPVLTAQPEEPAEPTPAVVVVPVLIEEPEQQTDERSPAQQVLDAKVAEMEQTPAPRLAPIIVAPTEVLSQGPAEPVAQEARSPAQQALDTKTAELDNPPKIEGAAALLPAQPELPLLPSGNPPTAAQKTDLEQLAELNWLYRSGKLTPQEYHQERAQIVKKLQP